MVQPSVGMSIPDYMQDFLREKLQEMRPKHALEFGTGAGVATKILAQHSERVTTQETFEEWLKFSANKLKSYKNIDFLLGYNMPLSVNSVDFVFVDGPKGCDNRIKPFLFHWDSIIPGSMCVFDDANQHGIRELFLTLHRKKNIRYHIDNKERGIGWFFKC